METHEHHTLGADDPGQLLKQAREARKWSVEQTAGQLRLTAAVVTALENNDFSKLPPPAFTRGYLRNYARLLELDEQRIMQECDRYYGAPGGAAPVARNVTRPDTGQGHNTMTVIVSLVSIAGLITWLALKPDTKTVTTALPPTLPPPISQPQSAQAPATAPVAAPTPGETQIAANTAAASPAGATPPQASAIPASAPPAPEDPDKQQLTLHFTDVCWVTVTDANRKRLIYENSVAGTAKTVEIGRAHV
jgi:cytoskeleton protein RodZ